MRRELCLHGTRCLKRKDPNRPLLLPRIKRNDVKGRKHKRLLKKKDLKKHHSEIQEAHEEKWLESRGRFPEKRWKIEQKRTLKTWFEGLDKDNSGEIDVNELADPLMSTGLAKTLSQVSSLVRKVDGNGSSGIDFQEFLNVIKEDGEKTKRQKLHTSKGTSSWNAAIRQGKYESYGLKKKKQTNKSNPIVEFTRKQRNEHIGLESVLSHERRKLLLDATMMQAERREKALDQIHRWRLEIKDLKGPSRFRKLSDISSLVHRLEADRVEKENLVGAMKDMIGKIQKEKKYSIIEKDRRRAPTPAHLALMKKRNVSMLRQGKQSIGAPRKALVYPRTRNPSFLNVISH